MKSVWSRAVRTARDLSARGVGGELTRARYRGLDDRGRERREDEHQQPHDGVRSSAPAAAEPHREIREVGNRGRDGRRNGRGEDIAVLDVRQLVRYHAGQLVTTQRAQDALRRRHRSVCGISSGGERIGCGGGNDVHARHRQFGAVGQFRRELVQRVLGSDLLRSIHPQHDFVRKPVRAEVHGDGEHQSNHQTVVAAQRLAHDQQEHAEHGQEHGGFECIYHD